MNTYEIPESYLAAYVGEKYPVYQNKWYNKDPGRLCVGWNWCGFFVGGEWLLYRKMYKEYAFFLCGSIVLSILQMLIIPYTLYFFDLGRLLGLGMALFGDSLYQQKAYREIKQQMELHGRGDLRPAVASKGGTSVPAVLIAIGIEILLIIIF